MAEKKKKTTDKELKPKTKKGAKTEAAENVVEAVVPSESGTNAEGENVDGEKKAPKIIKIRSKKYVASRSFVDRTKTYPLDEAVTIAKKTHYAKFPGSLEVNLVLRGTEGINVDVAFPHSTGQSVVVAVASDELLAQIEKGVINFTKLVAHPSMMPKLAKIARILGPKGLMPNPKDGTVSTDPEKRKKELEGGAVTVKSEKKAPLVHVVIGKLAQTEKELSANLRALLKAYPPGKVVKCTIASTMGPGVKVKLE